MVSLRSWLLTICLRACANNKSICKEELAVRTEGLVDGFLSHEFVVLEGLKYLLGDLGVPLSARSAKVVE